MIPSTSSTPTSVGNAWEMLNAELQTRYTPRKQGTASL